MVKLLHISDIHLGAGFSNKKERVQVQLRAGLWRSFEKSILYVLENDLDALLITGDLFDHGIIGFSIEKGIIDLFNRLIEAKKHIFYVAGNHDPKNTVKFLKKLDDSIYFHLFESDEIKAISVEMSSGEICNFIGCGHVSKNEKRDLIKKFPKKNNNHYWIGLAHASVPSAHTVGTKEDYMATTLSSIQNLNYDYFALGHIHIRQLLSDRIAYAGDIQGLNIKETGSKGGYFISLDKEAIHIKAVDFNEVQWRHITYKISEEIGTLYELERQLKEMLFEELEAHQNNKLIYRLSLEGASTLQPLLDKLEEREALATSLCNYFGLIHLSIKSDLLVKPVDIEKIKSEATVLSLLLAISEDILAYPELIDNLLKLPIFNPLLTEQEKIEQVQKWMPACEKEAIQRMVKENYEN